jgi:hypothetical protein
MMNSESMADMLRAAMEQRQGGKNSFTMTGQYAGSVEREGDREYVMYESPNGEQIKVYGNWNEYAVSRDEHTRSFRMKRANMSSMRCATTRTWIQPWSVSL